MDIFQSSVDEERIQDSRDSDFWGVKEDSLFIYSYGLSTIILVVSVTTIVDDQISSFSLSLSLSQFSIVEKLYERERGTVIN